jgi:2-polyprenyl-6-methoxyphenol hydroxylase-like FAD-dependent oxidoreductase
MFTAANEPISVLTTEHHRWQNVSSHDISDNSGRYMLTPYQPWLQAHRAHLHSQLKATATSPNGQGKPVKIHVSARVLSVDAHAATVNFKDGSSKSADVLIGADGVHSVTRSSIGLDVPRPFKNNHSAFRFIMDRQLVLDDPETASLASVDDTMDMWYSDSEKIVLYPTSNNKLLNFVCIHLSSKSDSKSDDYSTSGSKDKLLEVYKDFHPTLVKLLSKVDPTELKIYPLYDMNTLPTYINGRLALIGDAAHPFTPHLAQGGAQALEDAVSLGVFLEKGLASTEVPERLELYNKARFDRSSKIQDLSRIVGGDRLASGSEEIHKFSSKNFNSSKSLLLS